MYVCTYVRMYVSLDEKMDLHQICTCTNNGANLFESKNLQRLCLVCVFRFTQLNLQLLCCSICTLANIARICVLFAYGTNLARISSLQCIHKHICLHVIYCKPNDNFAQLCTRVVFIAYVCLWNKYANTFLKILTMSP